MTVVPGANSDADPDDPSVRLAFACQRLLEAHSRLGTALNDVVARLDDYRQATERRSPSRHSATRDHRTFNTQREAPALRISCFGRFEVFRVGERVKPCHNRNGQTILRYLTARPLHRESSDLLMDVFWPDDSPDVARHKLHCAMSALRVSLNGEHFAHKSAGFLLHEDGAYGLASDAGIELDVDRFLDGYSDGQRAAGAAAISHYESACQLYKRPFLPEDMYTDWSTARRDQITQVYVTMCSAIADHNCATGNFAAAADWALRILDENACDERAYRQLIGALAGQGRRSEAMRQYRRCESVLGEELGVQPMLETRALFDSIVRGDARSAPA
jgi:DNA-binding SARP family transcriptional activator